MKLSTGIYFVLFLTLISSGCRNNDDEEQRLTWSTDAPLSIPYRVRLQRFERGNLIRNHSFENGKVFKIDSSTSSFAIDGWQQVGHNLEWTDIRADSLYDRSEAFSGYRAVKISRLKANETDNQGVGILSDYIKVIPGNYSLSLFLKLENVMPLRARLGTRMFDAVDISIQFYDRNKILMSSAYNYPMAGQVINTSFKGLSFANYKSVSWFGWNRVTGKSNHFPFPEGDIPSDAHFVRIFIGLKGTGTLWVDSVNFSYTARNFSVAERMVKYTDTAFHTPEVFIPTPKQVKRLESVVYFEPDMPSVEFPLITTVDNSDAGVAANIISEAFRTAMKGYNLSYPADIFSLSNDENRKDKARIIISIGETPEYKQYERQLPVKQIAGRKDGYFVYSPPADPKLIIIGAHDGEGLINAAYTVVQMIDAKIPVFHNNQVIDYPDFDDRYIAFDTRQLKSIGSDMANRLKEYKINGALLLNDTSVNQSAASPESRFKLTGVDGYVPPDDSSLSYSYPLNRNAVLLDTDGKLVIPPVYHNEMLDNSDYSEICCQVTVDARILYSGSSFFSLNTDAADIKRFRSVMGPDPVFLDNSMLIHTTWAHYGGNSLYPGKLRLFNLFEPFNNADIREVLGLLDTSMYVVHLTPSSEISLIRLATAADFLWNSGSYSPDYALWKVLMTRYGAVNARELIAYSDKYSLILETMVRAETRVQIQRNLRIAQQTLVELTGILSGLGERLGNQNMLVKELQQINSGLRVRLNAVQPAERK